MVKAVKSGNSTSQLVQLLTSPMVLGIVFGLITYYVMPDTVGLAIGMTLSVFGMLMGMLWTRRVAKRS